MKALWYLLVAAGAAATTVSVTVPVTESVAAQAGITTVTARSPVVLDNLDLGTPAGADTVVDREGFAVGFVRDKHQAIWVSYRLTANEVTNTVVKRTNKFVTDPVLAGSATPDDYRATGYDRGHLAPAGDMAWSTNAMKNSFFMSNMSPQAAQFNRGIWRELEEWTRKTAVKEGSIIVLSGPIFCNGLAIPREIGSTKVEVPIAFYKVICTESEPRKAIGFILWNTSSDRRIRDFAVPVRHVEAMTGLDFYEGLPAELQNSIETELNLSAWEL